MGWILGWLKRFFPNLFSRAGAFIVGFVGPLIAPVMTFLASFFKKTAIFFLIVAAVHLAVEVFVKAIALLLEQIAGNAPGQFFEVGRMLMPSNLSYCVSLLVLAKLKSLVFYWVHRFSEQFIHT